MSNIYIQEPPTSGKVLLDTSVGDIDIELWSKEAPKACRNFVQLCMEGYYEDTIFHRIIKDFIAQGGDPSGTGDGGESIYGHPFKDEIHSRLRFVRRGLVAMANAGLNDNGSQFFFTLDKTPELQNKHTIFGKVTGNTVYNMIKLNECETDGTDRPLYPPKINKAQILSNPFDDIEPRTTGKDKKNEDKKIKSKSKATKNFKLLSFGEEAEENEENDTIATKARTKKLEDEAERQDIAKTVADKLRGGKDTRKDEGNSDDEDDHDTSTLDELKREARKLKRELLGKTKTTEDLTQSKTEKPKISEVVESYMKERQKYQDLKKVQGKKGKDREAMTLEMLSKFKTKLSSAKLLGGDYDDDEEEKVNEKVEEKKEGEGKKMEEEEDDPTDLSWMRHRLKFMDDERKRKVIDANVEELDRYEIHDPRNPLTKRRREASKQVMKERR
ncbi:SDCCAG10 [Mytilus coruscus]|uniref:Spliceosome-associated protein CWC27 homolog n=1 Tax=Mytilus coruscus TaxID=42192 RepID=A0A6J8DWG1_MYTCO|nr:SDCCAG10 [Mytilus coruscus]